LIEIRKRVQDTTRFPLIRELDMTQNTKRKESYTSQLLRHSNNPTFIVRADSWLGEGDVKSTRSITSSFAVTHVKSTARRQKLL